MLQHGMSRIFFFMPQLWGQHEVEFQRLRDTFGADCIVSTPAKCDDVLLMNFTREMKQQGSEVYVISNDQFRDFNSMCPGLNMVKLAFARGIFIGCESRSATTCNALEPSDLHRATQPSDVPATPPPLSRG